MDVRAGQRLVAFLRPAKSHLKARPHSTMTGRVADYAIRSRLWLADF